jgi:two-component system nitrate/nitrite response regulator NarL
MTGDLRLLVVASDPLARTGLATLLAGRSGYLIVGQVEGGESLLAEVDVYQPDVIVWDLGWEPEEGLAWLEELTSESGTGGASEGGASESGASEAGARIVALVVDEESAAAAWTAGAHGLLYRDASGERLLAAVLAVAQGLAPIEPQLQESMMPHRALDKSTLDEELTPRELEVLQLLAEGLSNKAMAQQLGISDHTVKFHLNAIMSKLGVQSRTAAVVRATRMGLVVL